MLTLTDVQQPSMSQNIHPKIVNTVHRAYPARPPTFLEGMH